MWPLKKKEEQKICAQCKYFVPDKGNLAWSRCQGIVTLDLVTGESKTTLCEYNRGYWGDCGAQAKYFEPKE